jgi:hypothetical protein
MTRNLVVTLHPARNHTGMLRLEDTNGRLILGPVPVAGRSSDARAEQHGNPRRDPLLRYGDTPTGTYRATRILKSGEGTLYEHHAYGPHGVIVLEAVSGDAALADAAGRHRLFIEGGDIGRRGNIRSTTGALRLTNTHQAALLAALGDATGFLCHCVEDPSIGATSMVDVDDGCVEADPPRLPDRCLDSEGLTSDLSRREALRVAIAAGVALGLPVSFAALSQPTHADGYVKMAYGDGPHSHNLPIVNPDPNNILRGAITNPGSVFDGR